MTVKGILGRPPVQEVRAALPSFLLADGTGPSGPTLRSQQGWQWQHGAHAFPQKTLWVGLWTPYSCGRWVIHRSRKASQRCHWIRKQACRERGKKSTIAPPAKEIFHVKCSQPLNPVSTKTSLHALPVCLWSQLRQSLWEEASAQSRPWATADDY